jgi:hypothetical protein
MSQMGVYSSGGGSSGDVLTLTGNDAVVVHPSGAGNINVIGSGGVTVTGNNGTNTLTIASTPGALNYTYVDTTPYVALTTDDFIGVDVLTPETAIIIQLPDAPAVGRTFTIKDKSGLSSIWTITVTTSGSSYVINTNYGAFSFLFDGTSYQVY